MPMLMWSFISSKRFLELDLTENKLLDLDLEGKDSGLDLDMWTHNVLITFFF